MEAFLIVGIMQRFKVCVFYLSEAVIKILLVSAAPVSIDDAGAFADGLTVWDAVWIFCDLHGKTPFSFLIKCVETDSFMRQMARFVPYISADDRQW